MRTLLDAPVVPVVTETEAPTAPQRRRRIPLGAALPLAAIGALQVALSRLTHDIGSAFIDEGLYLYVGHRMMDHFATGEVLREYPGSYFSGAPGVYPVLAAWFDSLGGLQAARDLSLAFAIASMVFVFAIGREIGGRAVGLIGAFCFAVAGPVIYLSQWATFDAMSMMLVLAAGYLAIRSGHRNAMLLSPAIAALLVLAFFTKYGAITFVPVVPCLAIAAGYSQHGWRVVKEAFATVVACVIIATFVFSLWGRSMIPGLELTTTARSILHPESPQTLLTAIGLWVGPFLVLAAIAPFLGRNAQGRILMLGLLGAALIMPLRQVMMGEFTSLSKHVAFGLGFATPLIGVVVMTLIRRWRPTVAILALGAVALIGFGVNNANWMRTNYLTNDGLLPVVQQYAAGKPDALILGDEPASERYALRGQVAPTQWYDTYQLHYAGLLNEPAYERAIDEGHFSVIYLIGTTDNGKDIARYLSSSANQGQYKRVATGQRTLRGERAGTWQVWVRSW